MDIFIHIANYLHLLALVSLLIAIWYKRSCAGISAKSQVLLVLIFTTRYTDLFTNYISITNTALKIIFLIVGYCTLLLIYGFYRKSYERKYDTFRIELLLIPCLVIAILINYYFNLMEVLWTFSIYLEAVAMIPQFVFVAKARSIHKHMLWYLISLATYRCLYIVHWTYRYYEEDYYDKFSVASGIIQVLLYVDFFVRIVPNLMSATDEAKQQQVATITTLETGQLPKESGHLSENMSTVLLDPTYLPTTKDYDKMNLRT